MESLSIVGERHYLDKVSQASRQRPQGFITNQDSDTALLVKDHNPVVYIGILQ
jgi:hypothetical protein